ncbi:hypothetical protein L6164_018787 [Bauhinia variegata]|uniref:Uncharacterized protein n=1 Tax=Bauhinia variegata TaxID=167791 RepID=A0ACB9NCI1_BAUVA|nr:hypothetical protein L6164_018787 [Bauhinia variegata]
MFSTLKCVLFPLNQSQKTLYISCSGPSRFDWDQDAKAWIYRRNKSNLYKVLESELEQLCGKPLLLS